MSREKRECSFKKDFTPLWTQIKKNLYCWYIFSFRPLLSSYCLQLNDSQARNFWFFFFSLLFSRTQVIIKEVIKWQLFCSTSSLSKIIIIWVKTLLFWTKQLSFDVFLMMTWERENKEPQIPRPSNYWKYRNPVLYKECFEMKMTS